MDELNLFTNEDQYVIVMISGQRYGLPVRNVREMLVLPEITEVPQSPDYMRGIINLRGQVIPLFDLRMRMGLPAVSREREALLASMAEKEEAHRHWVDELEASIREGREFTLPMDPHECAFGVWRDNYQTNVMAMNSALSGFDRPHERIHALAREALDLAQSAGQAKALEMIERAKQGPLKKLSEMFEQIHKVILQSFREIALVAEENRRILSLSVDEVVTVEGLRHDESDDMSRLESGEGGIVESVGRRRSNDDVVFILDTKEFFDETEEISF